MLDRVEIRNFQSIRKANLDFAKLNVILGNSDSGKSAVLRAVKLVAFNTSSSGFVTEGEKKSEVVLHFDNAIVGIERGPSLSNYTLTGERFTKAGKDVPDRVGKVLGFQSYDGKSGLHFAGQFEPPFLIMEAGTRVAQVLGDLTGISTLYEAVREANRRRLDANNKRKIRVVDMEGLSDKVRTFQDLPARIKEIEQVELQFKEASLLNQKIERLRDTIEVGEIAHQALERARASVPTEVDWSLLEDAERKQSQIEELQVLLDVAGVLQQKQEEHFQARLRADEEVQSLEEKYHQTLVAAKICPTCGSKTGVVHGNP